MFLRHIEPACLTEKPDLACIRLTFVTATGMDSFMEKS